MDPRSIDTYGGIKIDATPMVNPESELAADEHNRMAEDTAQLTRCAPRAVVVFTCGASPTVWHRSVWGNGVSEKPTVAQTATGRYTITYAASFTDPLGVVESVGFFTGGAAARTGDAADKVDATILTVASNIVTLVTKANGTAADVGDSSTDPITATVWLY
jgi:hypothetical protein